MGTKKKRNHGSFKWAEFKRQVDIGYRRFYERRGMTPPRWDMASCIERAAIQSKKRKQIKDVLPKEED